MGLKEDIKSYIVKKGYNISTLTQLLNQKNGTDYSVQNLTKKINNETLRYYEVLEIADVLGYEVNWIEKE